MQKDQAILNTPNNTNTVSKMSMLTDIITLIKELDKNVTDDKHRHLVSQIQSLVVSYGSEMLTTVEKNIGLVRENSNLKKELDEAQKEEVRFLAAAEFRRGLRTGNKWMPFCPSCKLPATRFSNNDFPQYRNGGLSCPGSDCKWRIPFSISAEDVEKQLEKGL